MIALDADGRWNEFDAVRPSRQSAFRGAAQIGTFSAERAGEGRHTVGAIEGGRYVPDELNVQTCLNCTRKRYTGNCKLLKTRKSAATEGEQ